MSSTRAACILAALTTLALAPVASAAEPAPANPWRAMLDQDLTYAQTTFDKEYIYGLYPGGVDWRALMDKATAEARADADKVVDAAGYQAVLRRFVGRFQDPHLRATFKFAPSSYDWPHFLVRYRGGRYAVVASETPAVTVGAVVESCDGVAIEEAVEQAAPIDGYIPGLEATRDAMGRALFVDAKSPLRTRPKACRIGGKDVTLDWASIPSDRLAVAEAPYAGLRDHEVSIADFGQDGAWVRLGVFFPSDLATADAYHRVIAAMPTLRDKRVIVFDVRGNGGGPYDWFMAVLRGLYGPEFTARYAQARTEIAPVFTHDPTSSDKTARTTDPMDTPHDTELEAAYSTGVTAVKTTGGATVYRINRTPRPTSSAPVNPVRAQVYVLTDDGCASACIAFVDELLRLRGPVQIGTDTFVDRRSGSPVPFALPSGSGSLSVPIMVRDGRERGENVPRQPTIRYDGDIADTAAVKAWVATLAPAR